MKYKMFKLVTGEIVIGEDKTLDDSATEYVLAGILQLAIRVTQDRQMGFTMIPFNPFAQTMTETTPIKKTHIIAEFNAPQEVINEYVRVTSNIVIPDKNDAGGVIV